MANESHFDQVKFVLLDAVGTVIYPDPDVIAVYHQFGRDIGSRKSRNEIKRDFRSAYQNEFENTQANSETSESIELVRWHRVVSRVFDDATVGESQFLQLWRHFEDPLHWSLYSDVIDAWNSLAEAGYELGIASNFDSRLRQILATHLPACQQLFVSTELGWSKPNRRFFEAVQLQLKARPEEILIVGDSSRNDIAPAIKCGWQAIRIIRATSGNRKDCIGDLTCLRKTISTSRP